MPRLRYIIKHALHVPSALFDPGSPPCSLAIAVPAICCALMRDDRNAAITITMHKAWNGHVPFFFEGVGHTPERKTYLPFIGKTLTTKRVVIIRCIH